MGKFRIKIREWWASDEFANIIYSTNGIIWNKIKNCEYDISDEWYYMKPIKIHFTNCESYIKKFSNIDDIHKFEQKEKERMDKYNDEITKQNNRKKLERQKVYNKLG